ncbi:TonB-dependent receptor domain-containing protein [Roseateles sp.]|uniref:TonB-dependent receptor n=1 Tax=Roseateles sp. TaxID=1971397 RepID=UPI0032630AFF
MHNNHVRSGHPSRRYTNAHRSQASQWLTTATVAAASMALTPTAWAGGEQTLEKVVITGTSNLQGVADSANVGTVGQKQLEARTVYRPGELLESTPGLIVSQHSGEGKANQFYLRGFNLDHGTDLRTSVDGMLVNQRSHGHGQGWTDLNFLIPELATGLRYKKGPYYAEEGDFASAGAVDIAYANELPHGIANIGLGQNGYRRLLLADSPSVGRGKLLYALDVQRNDGPFERPDAYHKLNGVLRYAAGDKANGWNVTAMGYSAKWNATDQIPLRAVQSGQLGRFDLIDPTDGGQASRYSLSGAWHHSTEGSSTEITAYATRWKLDLYSNFTYFLDNPVDGDQFNQPDNRTMTAINVRHVWSSNWFGKAGENEVGLQVQNDRINNGLFNTKARHRLSVVRRDNIVESSAGVWFQNATPWAKYFRTVMGLRADSFKFKVRSDLQVNSGAANDTILSPKLNFIFGPFDATELYVNLGSGYHSNDARGTVISKDPKSGEPVDKVTPLVRSKGLEFGMRTSFIRGLQTSISVYRLDFASELLFVGDAGTTEAGRPSRRTGFEIANFYKLSDWLTVDADVAFAKARFRDQAAEGDRIPGAVEGVASMAVAVDNLGPWFGAVQVRYFGPRTLLEDNSVRSKSSATVNARVGYKIAPAVTLELEVFNLTNKQVSAIDYYYTSRLPGEPPEGIADKHFHPIESRSFRIGLNMAF